MARRSRMTPDTTGAKWLTVEAVATRLGFTVPAVRRLARLGIIKGEKFGAVWRFAPDVVPETHEPPIRAWDAEPDPVQACLPVLRERLADALTMVDAALYRPVPSPAIVRELGTQLEALSETCLIVRDVLRQP